jgi:predicted transcriptional regulator
MPGLAGGLSRGAQVLDHVGGGDDPAAPLTENIGTEEKRMAREYAPLASRKLKPKTTFARPTQHLPQRVKLDDPAIQVMTDLKQVTGVTIDPEGSIENANRVMIRRGVRLLLVVDVHNALMGIITATDVLGEKPIQIVQARGITRGEIRVRDIMTPQENLEVLAMEDVRAAKVGHIVATLKRAGRQHAAVVDLDDAGNEVLRGLFSTTQISRQLGETVETTEVARSFAEVEAALSPPRS